MVDQNISSPSLQSALATTSENNCSQAPVGTSSMTSGG